MYSGHTVNITLCALTFHYYSHRVPLTSLDPLFGRSGPLTDKVGDLRRWTTAKLLVWVGAGWGYIFIVASRFHYTLDVFIGLVLSVVLFKFYMSRIRTAHLSGSGFDKLITWMERGAEDVEEYKRSIVGSEDGDQMVQVV